MMSLQTHLSQPFLWTDTLALQVVILVKRFLLQGSKIIIIIIILTRIPGATQTLVVNSLDILRLAGTNRALLWQPQGCLLGWIYHEGNDSCQWKHDSKKNLLWPVPNSWYITPKKCSTTTFFYHNTPHAGYTSHDSSRTQTSVLIIIRSSALSRQPFHIRRSLF